MVDVWWVGQECSRAVWFFSRAAIRRSEGAETDSENNKTLRCIVNPFRNRCRFGFYESSSWIQGSEMQLREYVLSNWLRDNCRAYRSTSRSTSALVACTTYREPLCSMEDRLSAHCVRNQGQPFDFVIFSRVFEYECNFDSSAGVRHVDGICVKIRANSTSKL